MNRRDFLAAGFKLGAAGLLIPVVDPIKRYWSLDRTMVPGSAGPFSASTDSFYLFDAVHTNWRPGPYNHTWNVATVYVDANGVERYAPMTYRNGIYESGPIPNARSIVGLTYTRSYTWPGPPANRPTIRYAASSAAN